MTFFLNDGVEIPVNLYNEYINRLISEVYKILCICEKCEKTENYEPYFEYTKKTAILLSGNKALFHEIGFTAVTAVICGLYEEQVTKHSEVKKIVLGCTNALSKLKKTAEK